MPSACPSTISATEPAWQATTVRVASRVTAEVSRLFKQSPSQHPVPHPPTKPKEAWKRVRRRRREAGSGLHGNNSAARLGENRHRRSCHLLNIRLCTEAAAGTIASAPQTRDVTQIPWQNQTRRPNLIFAARNGSLSLSPPRTAFCARAFPEGICCRTYTDCAATAAKLPHSSGGAGSSASFVVMISLVRRPLAWTAVSRFRIAKARDLSNTGKFQSRFL